MGKIIVSTVSVLIFSFTSPSAMAQLSDLLKGIKNAVEGGSVVPLDPVAKPAPSPKPAAQVTSKPVEQPPVKSAAEKKLELEWPESEYLFACNIKGKTFAISKHFDSDDPNIRISYGKRDAKTQLSELDFRSTSKVPLLVKRVMLFVDA